MAIIRGMSQTAGGLRHRRALRAVANGRGRSTNPLDGTVNQIAQLQMGGYNDAGEMLTLRAAIADYYQWSTTPLDYTMNNFHLFDSGNELPAANFTLAVLQQARNSSRIVQAGNHALRDPLYSPDDVVYGQLANDAMLKPGSVSNSFQTAAPIILAGYPGWQAAVSQGVLLNAGNIELWDFPTNAGVPNGFLSFTPAQMQGLAAILAAGSPPPTTGAPDDGSLLGFIAPASASGAPGRIAFTGTDAVLLASNSSATSYTVTLTSLNGGTLGIGSLDGFFGATSGTTLSFNGSLSLVNTVLAHLTDTVPSGTDVVHIVATDNSGNTIVRDVGVQTAPPVAPPTVTPGLLPANQLFSFTDGTARVVGQGQGTNLDIAGQLGNSGILVVGGVQSQLALAGNLDLSGNTSLLAALSPNAYSTASLTIGGTLSVQTGSSTYFSGTLAANTINNTGGTIRGNGTLDATGSASITNTGTIEAVADMTLGSQRLVVADDLTGTRHAHHRCRRHADPERRGHHADHRLRRQQQPASSRNYPYSPSTLVLKDPGSFTGGSITGFTFADRLVLENVTLSGTPTYAGGVLTVNQAGGGPALTFTLGRRASSPVSIRTSPIQIRHIGHRELRGAVRRHRAGRFAPDTLRGTAGGVRVVVPDVVLQTPLGPGRQPRHCDLLGGRGEQHRHHKDRGLRDRRCRRRHQGRHPQRRHHDGHYARHHPGADRAVPADADLPGARHGGRPDHRHRHRHGRPLRCHHHQRRQHQRFGRLRMAARRRQHRLRRSGQLDTGGTTPPGGINPPCSRRQQYGGGRRRRRPDPEPGQDDPHRKHTAQGRPRPRLPAVVVDDGGALILTGGASLNAQQQASVGATGLGLLTVAGGALALASSASPAASSSAGRAGSTGTVLNLELITATGQ